MVSPHIKWSQNIEGRSSIKQKWASSSKKIPLPPWTSTNNNWSMTLSMMQSQTEDGMNTSNSQIEWISNIYGLKKHKPNSASRRPSSNETSRVKKPKLKVNKRELRREIQKLPKPVLNTNLHDYMKLGNNKIGSIVSSPKDLALNQNNFSLPYLHQNKTTCNKTCKKKWKLKRWA